MKNNTYYTHELLSEDIKYYFDYEDFTKKIDNYFSMIYDINRVCIGGLIPAIRVHGEVHLYGFKVEDGGFFDIINNEYYDERNKLVRSGKIISHNANNYIEDTTKSDKKILKK